MRTTPLRTLLVLMLVVVVATVVVGCKKSESEADTKLGAVGSTGSGATGSAAATAAVDSEQPKSTTEEQASGSTGGSTTSNGSGSSSSGSSGANSGSGSGGSNSVKPSSAGMPVRVLWWNDTNGRDPKGFEIVFGGKSYKPDYTKEAQTFTIGPAKYGATSQLVIYPDGRSGKKITVPFVVTNKMVANSEQDAIHVEITDARLKVLGNAIDNLEKSYAR